MTCSFVSGVVVEQLSEAPRVFGLSPPYDAANVQMPIGSLDVVV